MRVLFFFLIFIFRVGSVGAESQLQVSQASQVIQITRDHHLSSEDHWHRILHYINTSSIAFFNSPESQIDSPNFFVAKEGKTNPQIELETFIQRIFESPLDLPEPEALQCRFPARYAYLKMKLKGLVQTWPDRPCPKFEKWFETLRGTSVSLVFSSYFLNNPSSTFGHTLLRINKAPSLKDGNRYELLDYGVNYAANGNTSNPLVYTYKGLFGGFPGTFTTVPYYYKVREYSNSESRDLWEYELNLKPADVDFLVAHIWEVGPSTADYWYLTENCSYFIFALLEAADPNLQLTSRLKKYVIPTDTVQLAWDTPGFVRSVHFRPSVRTELYHRLAQLTENEKNLVAESVKEQKILPELKALPDHRRRLALDAAIDDMDYLYAVRIQTETTPEAQAKGRFLAARSEINEVSERLSIQPSYRDAPHHGHGSRRIGLGVIDQKQQGPGLLLSYKFALHDLLDPVVGYPEYAQISFFDMKFSYLDRNKLTDKRNQLELENLMIFEVISLSPYAQFSKSISWRLHFGIERLVNEDCMGCHAGQLSGGAGYAFRLSPDSGSNSSSESLLVGYLGLKAGAYYTATGGGGVGNSGGSFPRWLLGAGPNLTLRARWNDRWLSLFEAWVRKDQLVSYSEYKEVSISTQWNPEKTWGIRATGVDRWFEKSGSLEFLYYY